MNIKNVVVTIFMLLWICACTSCSHNLTVQCGEAVSFSEKISAKTNGQDSFELKTVATDIELITWDKNEVSIALSGNRPKEQSGKEVEVDLDSDEIELEFQYDDEAMQKCYSDVKAVIKVPKTVKKVEIKTVSGDLKYKAITNQLKVKSVSGDVEFLGGKSNKVAIKTVYGDFSGKILSDDNVQLTFKSVSGDCRLKLSEALVKNIHLYGRSVSGQYSALGFKGRGDFSGPEHSHNFLLFKSVSGDLVVE